MDADFGVFGSYLAFMGLHRAAHGHVNTMAMLLILVALVQPFVYLSEPAKRRWAWVLVVSCFVLPVAILLEFPLARIASVIADLAGAVAIAALVAFLAGLIRRTGVQDSTGSQ